MKTYFNFFLTAILLSVCILLMAGCSKTAEVAEPSPAPSMVPVDSGQNDKNAGDISPDLADDSSDITSDDISGEAEAMSEAPLSTEDTLSDAAAALPEESVSSPDPEAGAFKPDFTGVTWLGDSLTQGALGDDNHNENNPQAPWRVLAGLSGWDVEGYGYFGYYAGEIFWKFGEDDGVKDPGRLYVFWVGSNDFRDSPDNITKVIWEIDKFVTNGNLDKYLVLGTTNRGDMDPTAYIGINRKFEEKYGNRYLDIIPYVEYGPDGVHLTEDSYRAIGRAVYNKITGQ